MADFHSTYELWQDEEYAVSVTGPEDHALQQIRHYAMVYGQDGPVTVYKRDGRKRIEVMP